MAESKTPPMRDDILRALANGEAKPLANFNLRGLAQELLAARAEIAELQAELKTDGEAWQRDVDRLKLAEKEIAELRERVIEAVDAEPELPGEPPAEMVDALMSCDKDLAIAALRIAVIQTKDGIRERIRALRGA